MITFFKAYPISRPPKNLLPTEADIEVKVSVFTTIIILNHHKQMRTAIMYVRHLYVVHPCTNTI
jgi:hypothetical protein